MNTWKIRLFFAVVVGFIYSAYLALGELRYAIWAKTTQARLIGVTNARDIGLSRSVPALAFEYSFQDDGANRNETDLVPTDWERPNGETVEVQYIPGEGNGSRLAGHRSMGGVIFFLCALAVMAGFLLKLVREANVAAGGSSRWQKPVRA